jgi:Domain of unknown function (DUF4258)
MDVPSGLLENIKTRVAANRYRIRLHAVRHMLEEGFDESDLIGAITGKGKIIELYPEELRCLILGYFSFTGQTLSPLHIVCDYAGEAIVDIVTAYIPQQPWWVTPTERGRMA